MEEQFSKKERDYSRGIYNILVLLSCVIFAAILKITSAFSVPLVIAIFLSLVALPLIRKMKKKFHIPWILGIFITLVILLAMIGLAAQLLQSSVFAILDAYPRYESRFLSIYKQAAVAFNFSYDEGKTLIENLFAQLRIKQFLQSLAFSFSGSAIGFAKNVVLVFLLYAFFLIEANDFQMKISLAFEGKIRRRVKSIIVNVIVDTTRFFSIKFVISLATGVAVYLGLAIIGLDFAVVWAFVAFALNFIPTFGSAISIGATIFFSVVQFFPAWPPVLAVAILMVMVNFVLGSVLEPRIEGDNLGISPFFILVSLSVWGWIWGFVGMLLAVPFLVFIKIVCENVPALRPAAILLGNKRSVKKKNVAF